MMRSNWFRILVYFVILFAFLAYGGTHALAAPPAPVLLSPTNGSTIIEPILEWQAVAGAAYYKVDLSTSDTFVTLNYTYSTYNTRITPTTAIENTTFYWRVSSVDAGDHVGTPSTSWNFVKGIPAPTLVSPPDGSHIIVPVLEWQAGTGAAYYRIEFSTSITFNPLEATYTTYNTSMTLVDTIAHGTHYWRVSGVDADGHVGTPSTARSFNKTIPAHTGQPCRWQHERHHPLLPMAGSP